MPLTEIAPVLVAGDTEADLGRLTLSLECQTEIARGVPSACAALRTSAFSVVIADVASGNDALAILRAAGRPRPPVRVICLLPADLAMPPEVLRLIEDEAFAIRRHPVTVEELNHLLSEAGGVTGSSEVVRGETPTWEDTAHRLSKALNALVQRVTGDVPDAHTADVIAHAVLRASDVVRAGGSGEQVLIALSDAFAAEAHERRVA